MSENIVDYRTDSIYLKLICFESCCSDLYNLARRYSKDPGSLWSRELIKIRANTNAYNLRNRDTNLAPPMPKKEFGKRCFR